MTRRDLQKLDPESARALTLVRRLAIGLFVAVLFLVAAIVGTYLRGENTRKIVTKSVCTKSPKSTACASVREAVARGEPIRNPCILVQRVTGRRGRNCPHFYIDSPKKTSANVDVEKPGGSGANSSPKPGSPHPGPRGADVVPDQGGSGGKASPPPGGDGSDDVATTPQTPAAAPTGSSAGSPPSSPKAAPPASGLIDQTTGVADDVIEQVGKEVGGAVTGVTCSLGPLCSGATHP